MKNTVASGGSASSEAPSPASNNGAKTKAPSDQPPNWLPYVLIGFVAFLAHGMALNADFYMDDFPHILEHQLVTGNEEQSSPVNKFRAIPYFLYHQIYSIAGPSSAAFHTLNLLIHLSTAFAVFATAGAFFRRFSLLASDDSRRHAALVGAMVFAVHPLGTEAVSYARCSMIQLVTLFSVLATFHALRWSEHRKLSSAIWIGVFSLLAAFSKDPGIFHVALNLLIIGAVCFERSWIGKTRDWVNGPGRKKAIAGCAVLTASILWIVPKWTGIVWSLINAKGTEFVDHWFTQGRVVWGYFSLMIAPVNLTSDHLLAWTRSPAADAPAGIGLLLFVSACLTIALGLFAPKRKVLCTLLALIVAPLALRFAYPLFEHFVEYRAYPALPWLGLLAGLGFGLLSAKRFKPALWVAFAVITTGTVTSALRTAVWSDGAALAIDALKDNPLNNRPRTMLQAAAYRSANYEEVLKIHQDIRAAYVDQGKFNASNPHKRQLDPNRAIYDLVGSNQLVTFALAEIHSSKEAVQFANQRIEHFRNHLGIEKEDEIEKALESLLKARNLLEEHGEEYDKRKAQAKAKAPGNR